MALNGKKVMNFFNQTQSAQLIRKANLAKLLQMVSSAKSIPILAS
jgi:hypothetical protein